MKSKTYKITLVIEAAIAALIAFCLAFFGPLSLNDMTYGEFDMQVFELCFTYPAIIIFIALFVVLAVISYKKEHTKKRYIAEIVLFAVLLIFVYFLGVFVPRTFRYEGVVMNAAEYTDIMHELKPSECFEGENTDYIEKSEKTFPVSLGPSTVCDIPRSENMIGPWRIPDTKIYAPTTN